MSESRNAIRDECRLPSGESSSEHYEPDEAHALLQSRAMRVQSASNDNTRVSEAPPQMGLPGIFKLVSGLTADRIYSPCGGSDRSRPSGDASAPGLTACQEKPDKNT